MIVTELYNGQGLGNQLWNYFVTKIIAHTKGYKHGVMSPNKFKGKEFIDIDFGENVIGGFGVEGGPPQKLPDTVINYYREKITRHPNGLDISKLDVNIFNIPDNTKIDGNLQSFEYIKNHRDLIKSWIKIKDGYTISSYEKYFNNNTCIIHIRGGDFTGSSAILSKDFYQNAMNKFITINSQIKFYIVTDDIQYAKNLFPNIEIIGGGLLKKNDINKAEHHMGGPIWVDWMILNNCKNTILSASSFSFWPVWLNNDVNVIAPMYWADYKNSDGYWSCGDSLIDGWMFLDKNDNLLTSKECFELKIKYEEKNKFLWR